jgi:hypothetical protein
MKRQTNGLKEWANEYGFGKKSVGMTQVAKMFLGGGA